MLQKWKALDRTEKVELLKKMPLMLEQEHQQCLTDKNNIEDFCYKSISNDSLEDRKTAKKAKLEMPGEALFLQFCAERERGLRVSGPIIQRKAPNLNKQLPEDDPNFTAIQECLYR